MGICPMCGEEIDEVNIRQDIREYRNEWGVAYVSQPRRVGEARFVDIEISDGEEYDEDIVERTYSCPHCEENFEDFQQVEECLLGGRREPFELHPILEERLAEQRAREEVHTTGTFAELERILGELENHRLRPATPQPFLVTQPAIGENVKTCPTCGETRSYPIGKASCPSCLTDFDVLPLEPSPAGLFLPIEPEPSLEGADIHIFDDGSTTTTTFAERVGILLTPEPTTEESGEQPLT